MSAFPLHLQRKLEQRWAARFVSPVASTAPQSNQLKGANNILLPGKGKKRPPS